MKTIHTLASSWNMVEKADWNCLGLWSVSPDCPSTCPSLNWVPTLAPLALCHSSTLGWAAVEGSWRENSVVRDGTSSDLEWHVRKAVEATTGTLQRQCIRGSPGPWLGLGPSQPTPRPTPSTLSSPYCSSTGWECQCWEGEVKKPDQTQPSGLLLQHLGTQLWPQIVGVATEQRRSPGSLLALALSLPSPAPPPTKVKAVSTPWGKKQQVLTLDPALTPKSLGTHRLFRDTPIQGHPFKTVIDNHST